MSFVHLHLHTEYSLLDGMARMKDVFRQAKEWGMPAVAITDHGALYGAFKFFVTAKDYGVKPIIGMEAYQEGGLDNNHLVLLARNLEGYKNLLKLSSEAFLENYQSKPRVNFDLLGKYGQGLIALSGCLSGQIPQYILANQHETARKTLKKYLDIFGEYFYLELQRHPNVPELDIVNGELIKLSREFGVPLVATNDVHYLNQEDAYAQEILLCIQTLRTIVEKDRPLSMYDVPDYYFKSPDQMKREFSDYPEAIENTLKIADMCNVEIPHGKMILPQYPIPAGFTPDSYLKKLSYENRDRVKGFSPEEVTKRMDYELEVINQKGYANYFLFVQDFVNWAKSNDIAVGPGRGSAAGSIVSYCLKITDINPLEYKLPFERFLNPGRPSPPDIDIDFADIRRDEVLAYVRKRYGEDKVAQIITFGTMESRMAVRDVGRALGMSYAQADRIAKMIPPPKQGFSVKLADAIKDTPQLHVAYTTEPDTKKVLDVAQRLEGLPRHASVHAAGVIISDKPLTEYVPLQKEQKEGKIITQYDMYSLDLNAVSENRAVGLLKMDFLGLRNLTILEECIGFVQKTRGIKVDMHDISLEDKKTYDLIGTGNTIGVFQLESGGMRRLAKEIKPTRMSDITAMVALYRPGPMDLIPEFIEGKKNPKSVKYLHKDLKAVLEETYGILVYQEQVMTIATTLAGFNMSDADLLRMAVGKKKKSLMEKGKKAFLEGMLSKGYPKTLGPKIFGFIEKFAAYGFNKAHAASYALIAYWTAYMKANYPVEFMTALLTAELQGVAGPMRETKMAQTLEECRKLTITVLAPDINKSHEDFEIEGDSIRFGLSAIKNVGGAAIESIVTARGAGGPFIGLKDFLTRVDLRKVNKKTVESLIKAGAFTIFNTRAAHLKYYPELVKEVNDAKEEVEKGQFGLFSESHKAQSRADTIPSMPELSEEIIYTMEKEVIGFLINKNPLTRFAKIIDEKATKKIGEINADDVGKILILVGIVSGKKVITTKKNNEEMAFLNMYDDTGTIEVVVFPKMYAKLASSLSMNQVLIFKGKVTQRDDALSVLMENGMLLK